MSVHEAVVGAVKLIGYQSYSFAPATEFLATMTTTKVDYILADVHMPVMKGLELQRWLKRNHVSIPLILATSFPDDHIRLQSFAEGAVGFLIKPFSPDQLREAFRAALKVAP